MKKFISLSIIFLTTLFSFANLQPLLANAAPISTAEKITGGKIINTEIIPLDESYYLEVITYAATSSQISTASTTKSVPAAKTHNIKNIYNETIASYTLSATFTCDGSTSRCTSASCSRTVNNSAWSFTSYSAAWTGNTAFGSYTAECVYPKQTVSNTITITCDANGHIS